VFMVVGMLGGKSEWEHVYEPRSRIRLLNTEQLREVSELGMEVGSHTMTHPRLSNLESGLLGREVNDSRRVLSEILGETVEGFCYPYGDLDEAAVRAVRRAGYAYACSVKAQVERSPYDLPRVPMREKDNLLRVAAKLRLYSHYSKIVHR
jgi:peptidoglycan/xylan/chitin deacetylase (PgdA/CDA1 family)